ncbi:MAG: hypothetical protein VST68_01815, partial [Nitrospirota bacterium]|nr:hypothetical protein [Nitrospirota bacterium]
MKKFGIFGKSRNHPLQDVEKACPEPFGFAQDKFRRRVHYRRFRVFVEIRAPRAIRPQVLPVPTYCQNPYGLA